MKAIIYTSNTGSTAEYAKLLGNELNILVYSAAESKKKVLAGSEIIYLGWVMAGFRCCRGRVKKSRTYP